MKESALAGVLLLLAVSPARAGAAETSEAPGLFDSAYRIAEGFSDGVYDFVRRDVVGVLFPRRLSRSLTAAPHSGSKSLFDRKLEENEARFLARARLDFPLKVQSFGKLPGSAFSSWGSWAAAEQFSVAADSFKDTLIERYQLELFGGAAGAYALDRRNWDPGFLSMAGVMGGAFLYLNGLHATPRVGDFSLGIDLGSGLKFQKALQSGGERRRLAHLELSWKRLPLTLSSEWGLRERRLRSEFVGLNYRLRF